MPAVDERSVALLGLVSLGVFFESYDLSILMSALKYIAVDLRIDEAATASWTGLIRLGAIPAFLLIPLADRIGRRKMFLAAFCGLSATTFLTAFAGSIEQLVAVQMAFRTFMVACATLAFVIVAEEFPAAHRGWGMAILGAIGATGYGFGALLFAFIDRLPYGWRALYAFGAMPLLLLPRMSRGVSETARFARQQRERAARSPTGHAPSSAGFTWREWLAPIGSLARTYPARVAALTLAGGLFAIGEIAVFQFCGYFTLTTHGWEPWRFSLMVIGAGALGMVGNVIAGRTGDALGRRPVGCAVATGFPLIAALFYHAPGPWLPVLWSLLTVCSVSTGTTIRALGTEVFPTSHRGTAGGWLTLVQTLASATGLALTGLATSRGWPLPTAISAVASLALLAGAAMFLLPETHRRELEAIATEES